MNARSVVVVGCVVTAVLSSWSAPAIGDADPVTPAAENSSRLSTLRDEIGKLETELREIDGQERGILGELGRLDTELQLREREHRAAAIRLDELSAAIDGRNVSLARLEEAQQQRRAYLAFRLREIYKGGEEQIVRTLLEGRDADPYWSGRGYASYLSERDTEVLASYRSDSRRSGEERAQLEGEREEQARVERERSDRRDRVAQTQRQRAATLERIRQDETLRRAALLELEHAAEQLTQLAESLAAAGDAELDIRLYMGMLDWPTAGELRSGFGMTIHPQFKTKVPHPGWDIAAPLGAEFFNIFEGQVVFADWMRGYGLTAIVDHGSGVLSIYAHASSLFVDIGEDVARGQILGTVGDTGSLSGPFLYFELRVDGEPTDPALWLDPR